jgi:hypothetical protein
VWCAALATGPDQDGIFAATSQMWPSGSANAAVRMPHGRSIGPFSSWTPRLARSSQTASVSSTPIVSWNRDPRRVRKLGQAAVWYSWMSPPRRSRRRRCSVVVA